ncbi:hypothetical protein [Chryseobacterium gambrini]|uniref:hypothetical protein n=1 Tax=Chryseobacterium gambrini TaxID=373672 RepID=UPI0022F3D9FE|nr:hypothetical protein [Chryseobacterium gambrini]WBX95722.1 hypothetical protein PE065_12660 [Chryseobacterium gambrini]
MIIGVIYKIILLFTLVKSYYLGKRFSFSAQNFLFIYLLITFINEYISFTRNLIDPNVRVGLQYNLYFIFCIFFFYYFFKKSCSKILRYLFFLNFIISIGCIIFFTKFLSLDFDKDIGIIILSYYIINCILWFYHKVAFFDENKITDDPVFWISTALLMWSCFFLFRITPMFYFAKEDEGFLLFLRIGQNTINIIMYIMFYISLKKYEILINESYSR